MVVGEAAGEGESVVIRIDSPNPSHCPDPIAVARIDVLGRPAPRGKGARSGGGGVPADVLPAASDVKYAAMPAADRRELAVAGVP